MTYEPTSITPIQQCVGIIHDFMMGNLHPENITSATQAYYDYVNWWVMKQLAEEGWASKVPFELNMGNLELDEALESRYYSLREQFGRKVLQSAASSM